MVTVAAALLTVAAMAGCGLAPGSVEDSAATPPAAAEVPTVVSPPGETERPPLSPAVEVPMAPRPTIDGPVVTPPPQPEASATPVPTSSATPTPTPTPTPTDSAAPSTLLALLPMAVEMPALSWLTDDGERTASWSEVSPAAAVNPASAIAHVVAARQSGGACAAVADAVLGAASEAATVALAAEPAPGAPFEVVLVRYPTATAAAQALATLQGLGSVCAGVATDAGVLAAGVSAHGSTVLLQADGAALIAEATAVDALLAVVLHEGAPPEAVAALLALRA